MRAAKIETSDLVYKPGFLDPATSYKLFMCLLHDVSWDERRTCMGHPVPRSEAWYHVEGQPYRFGGTARTAQDKWPGSLLAIGFHLHATNWVGWNSCLVNLYETGQDSVAWHSDDEPELGPEPTIVSLSLGGARRFLVRRKDDHSHKVELALGSGDLVIMRGSFQQEWEHCVPKTKKDVEPRINLTFRQFGGTTAPEWQ